LDELVDPSFGGNKTNFNDCFQKSTRALTLVLSIAEIKIWCCGYYFYDFVDCDVIMIIIVVIGFSLIFYYGFGEIGIGLEKLWKNCQK
jgi:hypothetical protein